MHRENFGTLTTELCNLCLGFEISFLPLHFKQGSYHVKLEMHQNVKQHFQKSDEK